MNAGIITIVFIVIGALTYTLSEFAWKYFKDPKIKFSITYLISSMLSMFFAVTVIPLLIWQAVGLLSVIGSSGAVYAALSGTCIGFTVNFFMNKPITYVVKKTADYEALLKKTNTAATTTPLITNTNKRNTIIAFGIVMLAVLIIASSFYAITAYQAQVNSTGIVKAYGVKVSTDLAGNNVITTLDFGLMEPGISSSQNVYIRNTGNTNVTLTMWATNWEPLIAGNSIVFSNNYNGQVLKPNDVIPLTLTLTADPTITGITAFSCIMIIEAPIA